MVDITMAFIANTVSHTVANTLNTNYIKEIHCTVTSVTRTD